MSVGHDRLAAANPIPDADLYLEEAGLGRVPPIEEILGAPRSIERGRPTGSRPVAALAVFVVVLVVAVAALVLLRNGARAPVGDDPVRVVTAFFDRWNGGDVDGALELVAPDVSINAGFNSLVEMRGLMEWAAQWDGEMEVECRQGDRAGAVQCDWSWTTAGVGAMGLDAPHARRFQVTDGLIHSFATPSYGSLESAIATYARTVDPDGFAAACDPEGAESVSAYGFAFDARCGGFLAGLEAAFIAQLESG